MRVSKAQFQQNRDHILEAAGRLFRERGLDAVSVAEVMQAAGLTHGGFYGHFKSKDDLIAQAVGEASVEVLEHWSGIAQEQGPDALKALAALYLNDKHLRAPASGCVAAALGPELARLPEDARGAATGALKRLIALLQGAAPGRSARTRRARAIAAYASWVGALVLARMSDDRDFSNEILKAVLEVNGVAQA